MILFPRGNLANLPVLEDGEPGWTKDEKALYIGTPTGNERLPNKADVEEINSKLLTTPSYPILLSEVGVLNKNYPYNDARRFGVFGDGKGTGGHVNAGSNIITVDMPWHNFIAGDDIIVLGAGLNGGNLHSKVVSVTANTITIQDNTLTTVALTGIVNKDYTTKIQNFLDSYKSVTDISSDRSLNKISLPSSALKFPSGLIPILNTVTVYSCLRLEGEYSNTLSGTILLQGNITKPLFSVVGYNYDPQGTLTNIGNGNNMFRSLSFKSALIDDTKENAPLIKFETTENNVSDTELDYCTFQNSAGWCIEFGDANATKDAYEIKINSCEFDNVRGGIKATGKAQGTLFLHNIRAYNCIWGFLNVISSGAMAVRISGGTSIEGCGQKEGQLNRRHSIYIENTSGVDLAEVRILGAKINWSDDPGVHLGGPIFVKNKRLFEMDNCLLDDLDSSSYNEKFISSVENDNFIMQNNTIISTTLLSYVYARMISISNATYKNVKITGNTFINKSANSFERVINTDYRLPYAIITDNMFIGAFTSRYASDIANEGVRNTITGDNVIKWGAAAPSYNPDSTVVWKKGDIVYNINPAPGGYIGWVCTADGSIGTWKGFGLIQA